MPFKNALCNKIARNQTIPAMQDQLYNNCNINTVAQATIM